MSEPSAIADSAIRQLTTEQIVTNLRDCTQADMCCVVVYVSGLSMRVYTSVALTIGHALPAPLSEEQCLAIFNRFPVDSEPEVLERPEGRCVLVPLLSPERRLGTALLLYRSERRPDLELAQAAVRLSAHAIDAFVHVDELQMRAEQIVERMRLREIQVSRNLIRGVIDSIPMGLALVDSEGSVLAVNRALADRSGREPAGMVGLFYGDVIGSWEQAPAARTFATRSPERVRRTLHAPTGTQTILEIVSIPLLDAAGHPHQAVEVWEDITERVALQTQLVRAEKLAAIGQLAASIAHEVGNPLQAIQGFLSLFLEQCPPEVDNQHFLKLAEEEIERIVQVLARLRDLYRTRVDVVADTDVNELVEAVLLLTSKQLERSRIQVHTKLETPMAEVSVVADQIKQVLLNLVLNAADAMQEHGGELHIRTGVERDKKGRRAVTIVFRDTGVGIAADQLPFLFDGLHTTKEHGMGLGLYTSKAIIERHMGRIVVQSTVGAGTTFTITLPVQEDGDVEVEP
jgi:PAS domain S-box-containing protein